MIVGVLGLGLIGGSFARVYHAAGHTVYACEQDKSILDFASMEGVITAPLTKENISECDLVLLVVPPQGIIDFVREMAPYIGPHPLVLDCCGVMDRIMDHVFISELLGAEKPTEAFFARVFAVLPFPREECMIVGDSLTSDMRGGVNAGIRTCWFDPSGAENRTEVVPEYRISDLRQVLEII